MYVIYTHLENMADVSKFSLYNFWEARAREAIFGSISRVIFFIKILTEPYVARYKIFSY